MLSVLRPPLALLLGVLASALMVVSLLAVWAKVELLDTDRYVAAVGPLSADPALQTEVVDRVTDALLDAVDADDLPDTARSVVAQAVRAQARTVVGSAAFADLWADTNRDLHEQALTVLTSDDPSVRARHGELTVNLTPVVDAVRRDVLDRLPGVEALPDTADLLPRIPLRVKVADAADVDRGRGLVRAADHWAWWTATVTGLALLLTVVVARRRLRALAWLGVGVAVAGGVSLLVTRAAASVATRRVPSRVASDDVVTSVYDALTMSLRHASWAVVVVGLVVAVGSAAGALAWGRRTDLPATGPVR